MFRTPKKSKGLAYYPPPYAAIEYLKKFPSVPENKDERGALIAAICQSEEVKSLKASRKLEFEKKEATNYALIDHNLVKSLGAIAHRDASHIFIIDESVRQYAKDFFKILFKNYADKLKKQHARTQRRYPDLHPGCIAFVSLKIKNKKICLIAKTLNQVFIFGELLNTIKQLNKSGDTYFVWVPYTGAIHDDFLLHLNKEFGINPENYRKACAEKAYIAALFDLYAKYGQDMEVTGVINCMPYPYSKNYDEESSNVLINPFAIGKKTQTVTIMRNKQIPRLSTFGFDDIEGYQVNIIDPCKDCQAQKDSLITLLYWAQNNTKMAQTISQKHGKVQTSISPVCSEIGPLHHTELDPLLISDSKDISKNKNEMVVTSSDSGVDADSKSVDETIEKPWSFIQLTAKTMISDCKASKDFFSKSKKETVSFNALSSNTLFTNENPQKIDNERPQTKKRKVISNQFRSYKNESTLLEARKRNKK